MSGGGSGSTGRFAKGQSGNPKGRPRKTRVMVASTSAFDIIVDKVLTLTRDGVAAEVGLEEALQHKTYQDAIAGSRLARREILKMIVKREKVRAERAPKPQSSVEFLKEYMAENANEAMMILGIVEEDPRSWGGSQPMTPILLRPWVVNAAVSRHRGLALRRADIDDIVRCSVKDAALKLPDPVD